MSDIIKTWPAFVHPDKVLQIFTHSWGNNYYFSLGKGRPRREIGNLWYTYRGRILGHFPVDEAGVQ